MNIERCPFCAAHLGELSSFCGSCGRQVAEVPPPSITHDGDHQIFDGRYRMLRKLGSGSAARVYEAIDSAGARVALRLLHPWRIRDELSSSPSQQRSYAEHEAELIAKGRQERLGVLQARRALRHEHLIPIFEVGEVADGTFYVASAFVDAVPLSTFGRMPWPRAIAILAQLCEALAACHAIGIAHHKVSAKTIYIESRPKAAMGAPYREMHETADFALLDVATFDPRDPFVVVGHRHRVIRFEERAPEVLMGRGDHRSDFYALGILAYQLIAGEHPFPEARGISGMITAQLKSSPRALSAREPSVPHTLDDVLLQCLAKQPNDRFADATELGAALLATL